METYTLHFDGSCWPNPGGVAAYGCTVEQEALPRVLVAEAGVTGEGPAMSNNVAEFHALDVGIQRLLEHGVQRGDRLKVRGDSQIVINIMKGKWRASSDKLYFPFYQSAHANLVRLIELGVEVELGWIPRELNTRCDELSKEHNKAPR